MEMSFVVLKHDKAVELGKEGTDKMASVWKGMMENGGLNANVYAVDPGRMLFVTQGAGLVGKVKEFVFQQEETDWWEYQSKQYYPPGRTKALMDNDERKKAEEKLGWRQPAAPKDKPSKKKGKNKKGEL
mmetsp:Transcript_24594/g.52430  ORF Transcript_24594/g.52430 Transcript_24594/m.52430 type:complete len:129 (+) Transcript_24594:2-388(+)